MTKCKMCKYQENCSNIVEFGSVWCITHRIIPKNFDNEYIPKQRLISFLENKIKEKNDILERLEGTRSFRMSISQSQLTTLQEVLDFVNKGDKNE